MKGGEGIFTGIGGNRDDKSICIGAGRADCRLRPVETFWHTGAVARSEKRPEILHSIAQEMGVWAGAGSERSSQQEDRRVGGASQGCLGRGPQTHIQ